MNILALNWNDLKNPFAGGAEVHLEELLHRLVSYGHNVTLFCSGWKGCLPEETIGGIKIIRRGERQTFNLVAPFYLRRLVKEHKYDILVEDINKIPFYTPLYLDLKTLVVIPHLFATTVFQEINFLIGSYIYLAERPLVHVYHGCKYNVISRSTADDIAARGVPQKDISVIHCGIDREMYSYDETIKKYEQPTILYVGRIKKYKSIQHLILAFVAIKREIKDARLIIVGSGDYLPELKSLVTSLGLDEDVTFPGFVSQEKKIELMRRSHLSVLPSLKEGWGLTNIESNALGTTVVAADSPGLRDSVSDGKSGLLYEYGNIDQLKEKILSILTNSERRLQLERGALAWAEQFNWDNAAKEFEKLIIKITGNK